MASTIDSISGGRFGVNLVTGWQNRNMSRWASGPATIISPAADYLTEYVQVLRDLWGTRAQRL